MSRMMNITLGMIVPNPQNPRKDFSPEGLAELVASIRSVGVLQPIVVVRIETEAPTLSPTYRLVAGERRWRAAKEAGLVAIPAVIKSGLTEAQEIEIMVVENLQRKDVSPIEEAKGFKLLLDAGITQEALGERLGKSQSHIANRLRLLDLPESVQWNISRGIIGPGHAKELLVAKKLMFGQQIMERVAESVVNKGLPVREIAKEIAVQSEEVAKEIAAENERKRLQEEELARQEEERQRLRAEREAEREVVLKMDTVIAEQSRRLASVAAGAQEQSCVWNDVMLFDQNEDAEQENTFLQDMWARGKEVSFPTASIDVIIGHATDSLEYMRSPKCNTCTFKAEINFQDERYFKTRCINPDRTCWGTLMDEGHSKGKQVSFPDADDIDGVDDELEIVARTPESVTGIAENVTETPEIVNEPVWTMKNTFLYTAKCPVGCEHIVTVIDQGQPFKMCSNAECEFNKPEDVGLFDNTEHIPKVENAVESNALPVKESPQFDMKSTINTHENCPENCIFKTPVDHNGYLRVRCANAEFKNVAVNWQESENIRKLWKDCRGFSAPGKEEPQPEPVCDWDNTLPITDMCNTACIHRVRMVHDEYPGVSERCKKLDCPNHSARAKPETTGGLIDADKEKISPLKKTCHHVDSDGRVLFVTYSTLGGYRTFFDKDGKLACVRSTSMPYVETRQQAEENLVEYAEKRGWKAVGQEEPEQQENQGGIYLPDVEGIHPMSTIIMSTVDKLLQFPLDSEDYSILLGLAPDRDLDAALFRDCRENGKFRIQQEKDRRLLAQVNGQLTGMGENIVQEG